MDGKCIFVDGLGACLEIFKQTHQKGPEAKVSLEGHLTTMSKLLQIAPAWIFPSMHPNHPQICNIQPFFTIGGCIILKSLFDWFHGSWPLASSLNFLFTLSWLYYAQVCWGLTLDVICSHFDMVVKWPPRLTLASGLCWWVCLNISKYAPKASANMQFPTNFDHWGVLQPRFIISDFRSASGFPWLPSPFI